MDSNEKRNFEAWVSRKMEEAVVLTQPLDQNTEKLIFSLWKDNCELLSKVIKLEAEVGQLTRTLRDGRYLPRVFLAAKDY